MAKLRRGEGSRWYCMAIGIAWYGMGLCPAQKQLIYKEKI
jgi:hypothetical protein